MTDRNQLAELLADTIPQFHEYADAFGEIADVILAAGYSKPRTITTAEELDALAAEVVVRSSVGVVWEKYADDYSDGDGIDFWQQVGLQRMYASSKVTLPAAVLYEPQP